LRFYRCHGPYMVDKTGKVLCIYYHYYLPVIVIGNIDLSFYVHVIVTKYKAIVQSSH